MDTGKVYHDIEGNDLTIHQMVKREPVWAAVRIQEGEKAIELKELALRAICLTRDYVGEGLLPAIKGWEWYDTGKALADSMPKSEWSKQFYLRITENKKE